MATRPFRLSNCQGRTPLDLDAWASRLDAWMDALGLSAATTLEVSFVDDAAIAALNQAHRGKDGPTDVLSFPAPADFPRPPGAPRPLGDLVVSIDRAMAQAEEYGHSFDRELGFLLAHGLLHLLGHDHETPDEAKAMFARQDELLAASGLTRG